MSDIIIRLEELADLEIPELKEAANEIKVLRMMVHELGGEVERKTEELTLVTAEWERLKKYCKEFVEDNQKLRAVVEAARVERKWHERSHAGPCNCAMCDALRALDGEP